MPLIDVRTAIEFLGEHQHDALFAGPRPPSLVDAAENALGLAFPPTYREFVSRLGAGSIGAFEIYGIVDDLTTESIPNAIWLTRLLRTEIDLPHQLVVIGSTGDGDYYCLEAPGTEQEGRVVIRAIARQDVGPEVVASDFGSYLLKGVHGAI